MANFLHVGLSKVIYFMVMLVLACIMIVGGLIGRVLKAAYKAVSQWLKRNKQVNI